MQPEQDFVEIVPHHVADAEPDFGLMGLSEAAGLWAVRWKLVNLERLRQTNPRKHAVQRDALENLFR